VRWAVRTAVLLAIAAVTAVLLRAFVVAPYYIPSASMEPTLHGCPGCNNDHVLVDKLSYRMHDVHRGDIVVFHRPKTWDVPEQTLIKRVIGLPGDTLSVRGGKLFVNGLQLQESYLNAHCPPMTGLGEAPARPTSTYGPIPLNDVFVMGDNRCDSTDSRAFGPVPESDIVGRAFLIIWPVGRIHTL
jgi:signal peptidase I